MSHPGLTYISGERNMNGGYIMSGSLSNTTNRDSLRLPALCCEPHMGIIPRPNTSNHRLDTEIVPFAFAAQALNYFQM